MSKNKFTSFGFKNIMKHGGIIIVIALIVVITVQIETAGMVQKLPDAGATAGTGSTDHGTPLNGDYPGGTADLAAPTGTGSLNGVSNEPSPPALSVQAVTGSTSPDQPEIQLVPAGMIGLDWQRDGYFQNPGDVDFDSEGYLYVADTGNHRIQKVNATTGEFIMKWGTYGSGEGEFISPKALTIDGDDRIFVADTGNHRIQVFNHDRTVNMTFGNEGSSNGQFIAPHGIAVDGSGNVYVSDSGNHRIQKFSGNGGFLTAWGGYGSSLGQFRDPRGVLVDSNGNVLVADYSNSRVQEFTSMGVYKNSWSVTSPWGITIDDGDNIYVSERNKGTIAKFNATGSFQAESRDFENPEGITSNGKGLLFIAGGFSEGIQSFSLLEMDIIKWGSSGSVDGQFNSPYGIAVNATGYVYVVDSDNHRVQVFDANGNFITKWGSYPQFDIPYGIAVNATGYVYVADTVNHRVQVFDANGNFITKWGSYGMGDGQFYNPRGIAVNATGYVYVVDSDNHRVQVFDANGNFIKKWGSYGSSDGQFINPHPVTVNATGHLYVADSGNHRVQVFDANGNFITKWGSYGTGDGQFNYPRGIAVNATGHVYVTGTGNHRVQVFGANGNFITKWGTRGSAAGQFSYPYGIAINATGYVHVADSSNHRVQVFDARNLSVNFLGMGHQGTSLDQLHSPESMTVNATNFIYVFDTQLHKILVFNKTGHYQFSWGSQGSGDGQFQSSIGMEINSTGHVYVADSGNHRIQIFYPNGSFINKWGIQGSGLGLLDNPADVLVSGDNRVYVADKGNSRIQVFTITGDYLTSWTMSNAPIGLSFTGTDQENINIACADDSVSTYTKNGEFIGKQVETGFSSPSGIYTDALSGLTYLTMSDGHISVFNRTGGAFFITKWGSYPQFDIPYGIAVNATGHVYVTDLFHVQVFDANGNFITKWGSYGTGDGQFSDRMGIAVNATGYVYVTDHYHAVRVQVFDANGNFITKWGSYGTGDGQFNWPEGIAINATGYVYVADTGNHRVQVFDANGNFITKWGSYGTGDGQFYNPRGIAVNATGHVYVTDTSNHRVQVFDANGNFITKWGSGGTADGQFSSPGGIAVNATGRIYVADYYNDRIQVFGLSSGLHLIKSSISSSYLPVILSNLHGISTDFTGLKIYVADSGYRRINIYNRTFVPDITLHSDTNNSAVLADSILDFDITDRELDSINCHYQWDSASVLPLSSPWDISIPVSDGWSILDLFVNDSRGASKHVLFQFYIDALAPMVTLQSLANDTVIPSSEVINLTVSDQNLDQVWYNWDGGINQSLSSPWTISVPVAEGYHWLSAFANDSFGHLIAVKYRWWVNQVPAITLLLPVNGSVQASGTVIAFNIEDNNLDTAWYRWDVGSDHSFAVQWETVLALGEGWHWLTVHANDTAGWETNISCIFYCEADAPLIVLQGLDNDTVLSPEVIIQLSIADYSLNHSWYNWDGIINQSLADPWQVSVPSAEGYHWLAVYANDSVGHLTAVNYRWWVNQLPAITLLSPANGTVQTSGAVITLTIEDNNLDTAWYRWDGGGNQSFPVEWEIILDLPDGWHWLHVFANDTVGWEKANTFYFCCDITAPVVVLTGVENDTNLAPTATVQFLVSDHSLDTVRYNWDGNANQTLNSPYLIPVPTAEGYHWLAVFASDTSGQQTDTRYRWLIILSPVITGVPDDLVYEQGLTGNTLTWTVTDDNPGSYTVTRGSDEVASGNWSSGTPIILVVDNLLAGTYEYTITIRDVFGNSVQDTVTVTVTEPSTPTTTTPTTTSSPPAITPPKKSSGWSFMILLLVMVTVTAVFRKIREKNGQ